MPDLESVILYGALASFVVTAVVVLARRRLRKGARMTEQFQKALRDLEGHLTGFKGRAEHQVPDLVFFNFLVDALEHAKAAEILVESPVPRAAYACTRASLEAAQDVLLMVCDPALYDERGAFARAFEVAEIERLYVRRKKADRAIGLSTSGPARDGEAVLKQDATDWDRAGAGKGELLLDAYKKVKKDKRGHWAALSRKRIAEEIATHAPPGSGIAEINDAMYGLLSIHSHPRPRTGMRVFTQTATDRYAVRSRAFDREGPLGLVIAALTMASVADSMRLRIS